MRIEDYAIIGDTQTLALVGAQGSIDWLCLPRFDSGACFASLLGDDANGRWLLAPQGKVVRSERRYRRDTLILETDLHTADGSVRLIDSMPLRDQNPDVVRVVQGLSGSVTMRMELVIRYDYGSVLPWVRQADGRLFAIAGPDALVLDTPIDLHGEGMSTVAQFDVHAGEKVPFVLTWHASHEQPPAPLDPFKSLDETEAWWHAWVSRCKDDGEYRDQIVRSLITLKALTFAPSGGIVAAGTTSLPENIGGVRNWDYRYCWLRDATFTLYALMHGGYLEEAAAFRDWLLRALAGDPSKLQIVYGVCGERRLEERTIDWLAGYEGSRPVRVGNGAAGQIQLDVYGEVSDALHQALKYKLAGDGMAWALQRQLLNWLESNWQNPDGGIWEVRGPRRHFTHSKMMSWVAVDRAIKSVENFGLSGPVERWRRLRDQIRREVLEKGWSAERGSFVQYFGGRALDASLLLMPVVGFLPIDDARVQSTVRAIERELLRDGFVSRYRTEAKAEPDAVDGLPGNDGAFLPCSFWLADCYALSGRTQEAHALYRRVAGVANDVGLLSEEYDTARARLTGNFPQAFSHVALVSSARNLTSSERPAEQRSQ